MILSCQSLRLVISSFPTNLKQSPFFKLIVTIYEPAGVPQLSPSILALINRVENLDKDEIKLDFIPHQRMKSNKIGGRNFKIGRRAILMLKQATGITKIKISQKSKKTMV